MTDTPTQNQRGAVDNRDAPVGQRRFFWKLFAGNVLLLVAVVVCCLVLIFGAFSQFYQQELTTRLLAQARIIRHQVEKDFEDGRRERLLNWAETLGVDQPTPLRITFISADGSVWGDSQADARSMENHAARAEVRLALAGQIGESTRFSNTVKQDLKYLAIPVGDGPQPSGVIRVALPVKSIISQTQAASLLFAKVASVVLMAAVVLALGLAFLWSRRIATVTNVARSLSRGDLSARAPDSGQDELGLLAKSLNRMGASLEQKINTIDQQRQTLEHLLLQLEEGVLVLNAENEVILSNPAAFELLSRVGAGPTKSYDHLADLPVSVQTLVNGDDNAVQSHRRLTLSDKEGGATILARGAAIELSRTGDRRGVARETGHILVLTDVTELARTVQVKADFVANASHELRTPLTAIRAAVETLSTVVSDSSEEMSAKSMLSVIDRHTERLSAIVGDLLDLSRLESPDARFEASCVDLLGLVGEIHARFRNRIEDKRIHWRVTPQGPHEILVNRQLLTLVLDNLVDNAIKFTPEDGTICVGWTWTDDAIEIVVSDTGCGMTPADQERVFERFYQVERARSGVRRGTGLGLSIVRHAINAMGGSVTLESELAQGTRVCVRFTPMDVRIEPPIRRNRPSPMPTQAGDRK